ncbi:hypothetical protein [Ekhidna sp.]|uniref:hypothetical protein n=1 Tax=Ekhidna sp. TaxID=2608089 RepID=UPI003B51047A
MKLFLRKIIMLSSILMVCVLVLFFLNRLVFESICLPKKSYNTLIVGDSRAEQGINPGILRSSINVSMGGDAYYYTFKKLKMYHNWNGELDTVVVSFAGHNIRQGVIDHWLLDEEHLLRLKYYMPFITRYDVMFWLQNKPKALVKQFYAQLGNIPYYLAKQDRSLGGFIPNRKDYLKRTIEQYEYPDNDNVSSLHLEILKEIVDYCHSNEIVIIFLNTPVHPILQREQIITLSVHKEYFQEVPYINLSSFAMDEKYFADTGHLNAEGATLLSHYINERGWLNLATNHGL